MVKIHIHSEMMLKNSQRALQEAAMQLFMEREQYIQTHKGSRVKIKARSGDEKIVVFLDANSKQFKYKNIKDDKVTWASLGVIQGFVK